MDQALKGLLMPLEITVDPVKNPLSTNTCFFWGLTRLLKISDNFPKSLSFVNFWGD
jgi:hypothetical protein